MQFFTWIALSSEGGKAIYSVFMENEFPVAWSKVGTVDVDFIKLYPVHTLKTYVLLRALTLSTDDVFWLTV
jgi:hypothetical protein